MPPKGAVKVPPGAVFTTVSAASPTVTGTPSFSELEPAPTDAPGRWVRELEAAIDAAFPRQGTPLLFVQPHHGSFARGVEIRPVSDVDVITVVNEGSYGSTTPGAQWMTGIIRPGDDWAAMIRRLLEHHLPELRWLRSKTSARVMFQEAESIDLVPSLAFERAPQPSEEDESATATPRIRDAIGAGRDLHAGLRAVDDLRRWLTLNVADIARIAGLSESTVYWWAEHPTSVPRPAKLDRLLGLQALAWGLVEDLGPAEARQWFRTGRPSPLDRLRRDPGALPAVEEQGYKLLQQLASNRLANTGPGRPVTDDDDRRDLARLAEQERDLKEPLTVEELDPRRLEPEDLE
jgi:hypothetical protein